MDITPLLNTLAVSKNLSSGANDKSVTVAKMLAGSASLSTEQKGGFTSLSAYIEANVTSDTAKGGLNQKLKGLIALTEQLNQLQNLNYKSTSTADAIQNFMSQRAKLKDTALPSGNDVDTELNKLTVQVQNKLASLSTITSLFA